MKKLLVLGAICFGASLALALPPAGEIGKAQKVISVLMADDIAALKAGKKTPVEVGDAAVAFSKEAETEAMKYVLLKGALEYYVRGKDYDKAADAAEAMRNSVKDLAPEDLVDAIRSSARGVRGSAAPRLLAILRTAQAQTKAKEGIAEARRALRKDVADVTARRALAEWLAASGDWTQALEAFIELGGKAGKTAQAETEKKDLVATADFWWEYEPGVVPSPDVFKAHAATLYKQELEKGELTGLKKAFVEKRLQQAETTVAESAPVRATAKESKKPLYMCINLSAGPNATRYSVTYRTDAPRGGWSDEYKTTKLVLRRIEAGSFIMGDDQANENHRVTLTKPFYMGVFEVTQKQWSLVMGTDPCSGSHHGKGNDYPVHYVSYYMVRGGSNWPVSSVVEATSFLGRLRSKTGLDFDLPTEAQWEYACCAGRTTTYYWGNLMNGDYAWYGSNSGSKAHPVGTKRPNAWGLYDMNGNVWEWNRDWHNSILLYGTDPKGSPSGADRVLRGGGWHCSAECCTSAHRGWGVPSSMHYFGFRLACTQSN